MPELATWRLIWREAVAPQLSDAELEALQAGLIRNDPALIQGRTVQPDPVHKKRLEEPTACCPIAYALWQPKENIPGITVDEVEECFSKLCATAEKITGEPRAIRHFLNWVDDTDRETMRKELLAEMIIALVARSTEPPPTGHPQARAA
jgi:hypothetical protein